VTYLEAILLGIVQGIAEFLPISSDGHLLIAQDLLGREVGTMTLTVALHVGTLLSIIVVFWNDLLAALRKPRLCLAIGVATLPLIPVGLFLKETIDTTLQATIWAGAGLCLTAIVLGASGWIPQGDRALEDIRLRDAFLIGCCQAIAPLPGVSRSGMTIVGGLLVGLQREAAARFSFLIAVVALSGATLLYAKDIYETGATNSAAGPLIVGTVVSFVVGVAALHLLLKVVARRKLGWFAIYCAVVGLAVIVWQLTAGE
jgi:undecaprenyl-diphosphatase